MVITVDHRPSPLLDLLWIREAHALRPEERNPPPLLSDTPAVVDGAADRDARAQWESAWPRIWEAAAAHAGADDDPRLFEKAQRSANGSVERSALLRLMYGPSWREHFGNDVFNSDSYTTWSRRSAEAHQRALPQRLRDSPERRDLPALVPAWRAGLTKIVTIPCVGVFVRRLGAKALLVTDATRDDSDAYRSALGTFT